MDRVHGGGPWIWGPCFVYVQVSELRQKKTTRDHSPASRTLSIVQILDVSHPKSTVKPEQGGARNTFAATI